MYFFVEVRWLLHCVNDRPDDGDEFSVGAVQSLVVWCERDAVTYAARLVSHESVAVVVVHEDGKCPS